MRFRPSVLLLLFTFLALSAGVVDARKVRARPVSRGLSVLNAASSLFAAAEGAQRPRPKLPDYGEGLWSKAVQADHSGVPTLPEQFLPAKPRERNPGRQRRRSRVRADIPPRKAKIWNNVCVCARI